MANGLDIEAIQFYALKNWGIYLFSRIKVFRFDEIFRNQTSHQLNSKYLKFHDSC